MSIRIQFDDDNKMHFQLHEDDLVAMIAWCLSKHFHEEHGKPGTKMVVDETDTALAIEYITEYLTDLNKD